LELADTNIAIVWCKQAVANASGFYDCAGNGDFKGAVNTFSHDGEDDV